MDQDKRTRRPAESLEESRKPSASSSYLANCVRPIQTDTEKYPGFYIFQESLFGNVILPALPRVEVVPK
ncbi:hypothetical protein CSKR_202776 [Clonorchis sinensis]|uniref:Uncharacterized protein n=1 Tax=Clonorchis sinensis TaxID=79923 RepID=A0A8T1M340_CLOSI|nr:hypothetical protein CSKR_202776 [Clonorchis sinensis]